ncbi:MAG: NAD(P)/FAD-dependent oxidoreductase [Candidatus Caldarchaeum sp.]
MSNVPIEFDVIVVGGGINGLTTAAYLAKTGLKTLVVERRDQLGTHSVTEEWSIPGFRISPHATSHWAGNSPCMLDLELEKFGLNLYPARYTRAMPFKDGKAMVPDCWDANGFYRSYALFSNHDANIFRDLYNALTGVNIMQDFFFSAPTPERWDWMIEQISRLPRIPDEWWRMTGFEMADYLFEDEHIKAWITALENTVGFPPFERIIGPLGVILMCTAFTPNQQAIGGSHQVPHALFRCIVQHGGKILQSCEVEKIIIEDGEAKGVVLGKHSAYPEKKLIARRAVVSDLSPVPTFIDLVGEEHLDKQVARVVKYQYDYDWHVLFTAAFMTTKLPDWKGNKFNPNMREAWMFNCGVESMADVEKSFMDCLAGRIPDPITALGADFILTLYDKTAAPPGYHNVQLWPDVPYSLHKKGGPDAWDEITPEITERVADMVEEYAPGFRTSIKTSIGVSPLDIYRKNPSAIHGPWNAGPCKHGQLYFDRPFLGCNPPRTPIKKLYLSNGTWPWSMSWLASGYIAATEIVKDLGIPKPSWWSHVCFEWFPIWAERNGIKPVRKVTV